MPRRVLIFQNDPLQAKQLSRFFLNHGDRVWKTARQQPKPRAPRPSLPPGLHARRRPMTLIPRRRIHSYETKLLNIKKRLYDRRFVRLKLQLNFAAISGCTMFTRLTP